MTSSGDTKSNTTNFHPISIIPADDQDILEKRDGAYRLVQDLVSRYTVDEVALAGQPQEIWEAIGRYLMNENRYLEAVMIFKELYSQQLLWQQQNDKWTHKGMPLVWISECYTSMGFTFHARVFLMLTLCEDVIREQGRISPSISGVYFRLAWNVMSEEEMNSLSADIYNIYHTSQILGRFPEYLLTTLTNKNWYVVPSIAEYNHYAANTKFIQVLINESNTDKTGKVFELLTSYIFSCMPGCLTRSRVKTYSTDYDLVCSMEGYEVDFRSEFGRYFLCECKDWDGKIDFSTLAKFSRVLDSVKMKFGVLLSKKGITGQTYMKDAAREQRKLFHDRGILIIDFTEDDFTSLTNNRSLQAILREKYEKIRLDSY